MNSDGAPRKSIERTMKQGNRFSAPTLMLARGMSQASRWRRASPGRDRDHGLPDDRDHAQRRSPQHRRGWRNAPLDGLIVHLDDVSWSRLRSMGVGVLARRRLFLGVWSSRTPARRSLGGERWPRRQALSRPASRRRRGPKARVERACRLAIRRPLEVHGWQPRRAALSAMWARVPTRVPLREGRAPASAPIRTAWRSAREMIVSEAAHSFVFSPARSRAAVALELDPISIVDDAVRDRVAEGSDRRQRHAIGIRGPWLAISRDPLS